MRYGLEWSRRNEFRIHENCRISRGGGGDIFGEAELGDQSRRFREHISAFVARGVFFSSGRGRYRVTENAIRCGMNERTSEGFRGFCRRIGK